MAYPLPETPLEEAIAARETVAPAAEPVQASPCPELRTPPKPSAPPASEKGESDPQKFWVAKLGHFCITCRWSDRVSWLRPARGPLLVFDLHELFYTACEVA